MSTIVEAQLKAAQSPWYKSFLEYDPGPDFERVTVPVLAVFGELDVQVPAEINQEAMTEALAVARNQDFSSVILP